MRTVIAIAAGGALGALARHGLTVWVSRRAVSQFPWGTFVVNISGAFALGLFFELATERWSVAPWVRSFVAIGFLGAYTTFSTLMLDSYSLGSVRALGLAVANVAGSCTAGLVAVYLGIVLARAF